MDEFVEELMDIISKENVDYRIPIALLLLKVISDEWKKEYEHAYQEALDDGLSESQAKEEAKNPIYHDIEIEEEFLWSHIREDVSNVGEIFSKALKSINDKNDFLNGITHAVNIEAFLSDPDNKTILRDLVELISDLDTNEIPQENLSSMFEKIIVNYSLEEAKKGGIYTPREISELLFDILDPQPNDLVYDPSSSYGEILIKAHDHVKEKLRESKARRVVLHGEESKSEQFYLSKVNFVINGIFDFHLNRSDALMSPSFQNNADIVVSNPKWNQKGYSEDDIKEGDLWRERFTHGFATGNSADWNWVQHMLASAKDDGKVGVVLDTGVLFRSWGKDIRKSIIQEDLIECVILLPEKLFYSNQGAPGTVLILNKDKPEKRKGKILFVNASDEYIQHPDHRRLNVLKESHRGKISQAYENFENLSEFSRVVDLEEIKENEYNLNVTLYVFPEVEQVNVDLAEVFEDVTKLDEDIEEINLEIKESLFSILER